jgi:flagellar protein FliO/FliZ
MRWEKQSRLPMKILHTVLRKAGVLTCSFLCTFLTAFSMSIGIGKAAGNAEANLPQGDMGMASLKMGAALLLVIGMIFGIYYLSKRIRDGRFSLNRNPAMRVIGSLSLASKQSIALVEVCGEWLVLGVGAESITLLRRIEDPPVNNNEAISTTGGTNGSFQSLLRRKMKRSITGNVSTREKDGTPGK